MKFTLLHVYTLVSLVALIVGSHAVTPEVYWKSALPNSPMPKTVKELLKKPIGTDVQISDKRKVVYVGVQPVILAIPCVKPEYEDQMSDKNVAVFFLEKDLHQGSGIKLNFTKTANHVATFLPREIANSIPFSSNKLPQIYKEFSVKPESVEAQIIKQTINECEHKDIKRDENKCVTSLESMVDFSTTKLGKKVKAISTQVNAKKSSPLQKYKVLGANKLGADKSIVCHKKNYLYAVFYCNKSVGTSVYEVSLVGENGTKVKAVAVCYTDTLKWNPKLRLFQVLKVRPGSVPICHFVSEEHVVWVPYQ